MHVSEAREQRIGDAHLANQATGLDFGDSQPQEPVDTRASDVAHRPVRPRLVEDFELRSRHLVSSLTGCEYAV